jgi:hypothetical protein
MIHEMNQMKLEEINAALEKCCEHLSKILKRPVRHDPARVKQEIESIGLGHERITTTIYTRFFAIEVCPFKKERAKL